MLKVLIVDDDFMLADRLEEVLVDGGYEVCGIAGTVEDAIALAEEHQPDLGIIDLRLAHGRYGTEIVAALRPHQTFGVIYATGNPGSGLLRNAAGEACIGKPYSSEAILAALRIVHERISDPAIILPRLPKGFALLGAAAQAHP